MRHAKSDWSGPQISDFERPINKRGTRNAIRVGQWMNENNHIPQKIISSPALRAKETIELVTEQISKFNLEDLTYEDELYLAGFTQLIEFINTFKDKVQSLMLVGHNPGIENLVNYLCDRSGDKETIVTTANLFIFKFSSDSFNTAVDIIELVEAIKPRELN
jgi:phosphohistidine phosphatase|tara:strand:- start:570 stop:1055 length:486 start_codon:yes stop_codon:yes gene_type:complete